MRAANVLSVIFWVVAIAAPLAICAVATAQIPDVAEIPLRWSTSGEVSQWGPPIKIKAVFWFIGAVMSAGNAAMAACFALNDRLFDEGLINGDISRNGALKAYVAVALVTTAFVVAFYACTMADALAVFSAEGLR